MNVFALRDQLIHDYATYIQSFVQIRDTELARYVQEAMNSGVLWPAPLVQLNPTFEPGESLETLIAEKVLHPECRQIFQRDKDKPASPYHRWPLKLHRHQSAAVRVAAAGHHYILTTGTGSGKSLTYILPIVNHVLQHGRGRGIQAIVVYPMNALANSQEGELRKFLQAGYAEGQSPVTFARYTGQESDEEKRRIMAHPPDILLTNYVMLELILTRPAELQTLVRGAQGLRFLVLDELHTYRGRQGADVALLVRRAREALHAEQLQCVGTSATLAGPGSLAQQRADVAAVASRLFGVTVHPEHIISESLRRATPERDFVPSENLAQLQTRVTRDASFPSDYATFVQDPLASWIESTLGLAREPVTQRLVRVQPRALVGEGGAAEVLSRLTQLPIATCEYALQRCLLAGYSVHHPDTGFPAFAFRLHQFISRGDTVYASLDEPRQRYITVFGQTYVPGHRDRVLLPLAFCRECGQAYFVVSRLEDRETQQVSYLPRELTTRTPEDGGTPGFLHFDPNDPWPTNAPEELDRLPEAWVEERQTGRRVKPSYRTHQPKLVTIAPDGLETADGQAMHFVQAPFRFCLQCGVNYGGRQSSDFAKLATLGSEGRSTATTLLTLSAVRSLRQDTTLPEIARKLLSFTDNRQDASLQAGHFNDFVDVALLRAALWRAAQAAGTNGLTHEQLTQKVFEALQLPLVDYAINPEVRFQPRYDTERALRDVLGYRLYHDLRRGWRITSPNLEQCGLLIIHYPALGELCAAEDVWQAGSPALASASPAVREKVARVLLDYMRRELALNVSYLNANTQEQIIQKSLQHLRPPWALDENERLEHASVLFPRASDSDDYGGNVYLSGRGGFGQYLRRASTLPHVTARLTVADTDTLIQHLLKALVVGGLVAEVEPARRADETPGYQLQASALVWVVGDGARAFHDPIRMPREAEAGGRTNPFFVEFYRTLSGDLRGLMAREHTAQVPAPSREEREALFRRGQLPILFCSPTMELGVDIAELNVVNMRNVPPTPANYAQRSGRAGRSGQPALVFTYCAGGSPHDQYFFKRPEQMVAGAVTPPRLDLANEDLVRAHVHAVWLAETGAKLGTSLKDVLDLTGEQPSLALLESVRADLQDPNARRRAYLRAEHILASLQAELSDARWYTDHWLRDVLEQAALQFDQVCQRWRELYRAALQQRAVQHRIIGDASRSPEDRRQAQRLRLEAENQIKLLTDSENLAQSDFYSYRYFASEGFLPGYSFPRLPLSAYLPGRRQANSREDFLSRPRFLAISEFGPRAIVYHEGSKYEINKVILAAEARPESGEGGAFTRQALLCPACGYLHIVSVDKCERCGAALTDTLRHLFQLQNVSTQRRERISSDEEERFRLGYELRTGVRFADEDVRSATVTLNGQPLATLTYGQAATLWRINLGWKRRANPTQYGFLLDVERGLWAKEHDEPDGQDDEQTSARVQRVVPFVSDRRNCLLIEPAMPLDLPTMASLGAALANALQVHFQLEESEVALEPLPDASERRLLLIYESAEGGAGALRRLVDEPDAWPQVARRALELCHFDPDTGDDRKRGPRAKDDCEAACYDCLLSYYNQRDQRWLDRWKVRDLLRDFQQAHVSVSPVAAPRGQHLQTLLRQCESQLEQEWLKWLNERGYRLPTRAQVLLADCQTRPDFVYDEAALAVYVDGPHHLYPERQARDRTQQSCLEDLGYNVVRFVAHERWQAVVAQYPNVFGSAA